MNNNMIVLDLLEENLISVDDALQLLRALSDQQTLTVDPQEMNEDEKHEMEVNLVIKG